MTDPMGPFFVVPGVFGYEDATKVLWSGVSLQDAMRFAGSVQRRVRILEGWKRKGDVWRRGFEGVYRVVFDGRAP